MASYIYDNTDGEQMGGLSALSRNVPASQSRQKDEPAFEVPLVQAPQAVSPACAAKYPASHGVQVSAEVAPAALLLVPGGQRLHISTESAPREAENVPRGHCSHCERETDPVASPYFPLGQASCSAPPGQTNGGTREGGPRQF